MPLAPVTLVLSLVRPSGPAHQRAGLPVGGRSPEPAAVPVVSVYSPGAPYKKTGQTFGDKGAELKQGYHEKEGERGETGEAEMTLQWYRQDREAVLAALARGERPDMATTLSAGVVDELVALHEDLGVLPALGETPTARERRGVPDALLLRTLATLPFVAGASLSGATETLFKEPAILLRLGWAPAHLRAGTTARHRHPEGRQPESLPCHPDTLRDALRRVAAQTWETVQRTGVRALYAHGLMGGHVDAVEGSGIGPDLRVVALVCVSTQRPLIVAWRLLEGDASEKGTEASVTRSLVEQALALGGAGCLRLLLAAALYADGPLLAWLKCVQGIDALAPLPEDRLL